MRVLLGLAGIVLLVTIGGAMGGIGAVWALKTSIQDECGYNPFCRAGKFLNLSQATVLGQKCLSDDEVTGTIRLAMVLYAPENVMPFEEDIRKRLTEARSCVTLRNVSIAICEGLNGGNSGAAEACSSLAEAEKPAS